MKKTSIQYIFRQPRFPIIGNIEAYFIGAKTAEDFIEQLQQVPFQEKGLYNIVDSGGEGWSFSVEHMAMSPLTSKKRWIKKEIISLFNQRKNKDVGQQELYSEKTISNKRLDQIVADLVRLTTTV
jgi:hypothetical protein